MLGKIKGKYLLLYNTYRFKFVSRILRTQNNEIVLRGCSKTEIVEALKLYERISGKKISKFNKALINKFGNKNLILAVYESKNSTKIIGINLYYINFRDIKDKTIHGGFIGVLPEFENQGIATKMRNHAKSHFKANGFSGISSRISKSNIPSLKTAKKVGFIPVEEYFDKHLNETRYYLQCKLK